MIKSDRQKGTRSAGLNLTNEVFCVLWSHHIQGQRLQVPEVLLDDRILKSITPVDICKEKVPSFKKKTKTKNWLSVWRSCICWSQT